MACGIELGSVLRICRELLVVAALMPPNLLQRRRDVCPAREALLDRFLFDDLFTASGLGVLPLLYRSIGTGPDAVACFALLFSDS